MCVRLKKTLTEPQFLDCADVAQSKRLWLCLLDAFLEFVLEYFVDEFSFLIEEKGFEVGEYLSVFGVVDDAMTFGEHDIEVFVEEFVNVGGIKGCLGRRKIRPCKSF